MEDNVKKTAFAFIMLIGVVSLFSDMTHEGAASIMGAYLGIAGASAATIGFVSGLGECIGYSLRLATGWLTDRTKHYWTMTITGYVIDCLAIPALALVPKGGWIWACALIIIQRMGKAIKKPAKDTILSFAATQNGTGKSFAIQEFMDQIGAFLGPVLLFLVLAIKHGGDMFTKYSLCFAILGIPAVITVTLLLVAKMKFPNPEKFEPPAKEGEPGFHVGRTFVIYNIAISLCAAGFMDFTLITLHTAQTRLVPDDMLSLIYALAMVLDAFSALLFGWLFDKKGIKVLMISTLISLPYAVLIFALTSRWALILGVMLWGIGMGAQESIMKAAIAEIVPKKNRSTGYGIFQTAFGVSWFLGSWLMGALYDTAPGWMIAFSVLMQLAAVPLFWICGNGADKR